MTKFVSLPLSAKQLISKARADTGIDIVDEDVVEALTVLVKSFNEEAGLHEVGAMELQIRILQMLKNRLRMFRDFRDHPQIGEQEVNAPIMILGTLRTGSTKLQRVLSESGDFNWLPYWKAHNFASVTGKPDEDVSLRIAEVDASMAYNQKMSPEIQAAHEQGTHLPDEETMIAMQSFRSSAWFGYGNIPGYLQWVSQQDITSTYELLLDALKYLQWQGLATPSKRWILKSPFNLGLEDVVTKIFPGAYFVVTHRPPAQTLPSLFNLLAALYKCHTDNPQIDHRAMMMGQTMTLERHIQVREANPGIPILDVHYKDSITDIEKVIRCVYAFAGQALSKESLQRMSNWNAGNPIHKHGARKYSLADFDITEEEVTGQCPNYMAWRFQRPSAESEA